MAGRGITNIIRGQFRADDFAADKIKAKVQLAPSLAFHFDFVFVFQPLALTEDLQPGAVDDQMNGPLTCRWPRHWR